MPSWCLSTATLSNVLSSIIALFLCAEAAFAAEVVITWDSPTANVDGQPVTDLGGYRVYYGTQEGHYTGVVNVGLTQAYTVLGLARNTYYYFAISAYDVSGNESPISESVRRFIPASGGVFPDDYDGDGIKNVNDNDADGDGISRADEARFGTSDVNPDTDDDGVTDIQEIAVGSNPVDAGSSLPVLNNTLCAGWNGFLGGMWNVYEHNNRTANPITVQTTLFDFTGIPASAQTYSISPHGQYDALIHDFYGRMTNSYGKVCSHHGGNRGDLDGRMVYYKPNTTPWLQPGEFQFAFAMPMTNGKRGSQYLPINNFHGSLAARDWGDVVGNWIQITNLGGTAEQGELTFFGMSGNVVARRRLTIPAGGRSDYPAHELGSTYIGLAEWRPDSYTTSFLAFAGRYHYDNPWGMESFDGAIQIEGLYGSGDTIYAPVDTIGRTSVLEVSNTLPEPVTVFVGIRGTAGGQMNMTLPAFGTQHILVEPFIGPNQLGFAELKANRQGAIIAQAMHYGREWDGGMSYLYGLPAKPALGSELRGSYNTYLDQDSWLVTVSPGAQDLRLRMTRPDGTVLTDHWYYTGGTSAVYLNQFDGPDEYGSVSLSPARNNSVVAWVLRLKSNEYVIPIPMR